MFQVLKKPASPDSISKSAERQPTPKSPPSHSRNADATGAPYSLAIQLCSYSGIRSGPCSQQRSTPKPVSPSGEWRL